MTIVDNNTTAITQSDLPNGWEVANLEDVVDILDSKRVPVNAKERANRVGPIPYYGATGQVGWIDDFLFDEELVLLGEDGAPFLDASKPKAYKVRGKSWVNNHAHVLRALGGIPNGYIKYYLDTFDYHGFVTGTTRLKLNQTSMRRIPVPIAPPNEQKRIVAEIEKQFSRLDEAVDNLKRVKANLKRYKASVLKAAAEGKLTEEWRNKNLPAPSSKPGKFYTYAILCDNGSIYIGHTDDIERRWKQHLEGKGSEWTAKHKPVKIVHWEETDTRKEAADREKWLKTGYGRKWLTREYAAGRTRQAGQIEPADKLLERILAERRKKWEEAELAKIKAKGKKLKDDKWKKKYKEPKGPELSGLPSIPGPWTYATLPQLGELNRGKSKHRPRNDPKLYGGPYPFVQTGDIRHATGVITDYSQTYSEEGLKQSRLWPKGTLCITIAANIADTAILGLDACFPDSVVGFIPETEHIKVIFVEYFIRTAKEDLERFAPATAQKNINLAILSEVAIPIMSMEEQKLIIQEIEHRLSVAERIEKTIEINMRRNENLRQAILCKAFSGELVEPFHGEESAAILLEKIQKQREKEKIQKPAAKKGRRIMAVKETHLTLEEVDSDHLFKILTKNVVEMDPKSLWQKSKLTIDDFYAQLKREVEGKLIEETPERQLKLSL